MAEAREGDHTPAGGLAQGLREAAPQPHRAEPLVQEHEARGVAIAGRGRRPRRGARRPWPWRASLVSRRVRSATRCATCEHAARDRRRALDPARGRARDDRDRALPELAARRARTRPRGLRRAVALVGRRPRGLLGRRSGTSSASARTRPTSASSAAREMPGAEWFPGARLNYAEHVLGTDEDADRVAVVARSQTREPIELTFGELRDAGRAGARRPAAPGRRPGRPRRRLPAEHPRDARRLPRHRQPRGDVGRVRARVRRAQRAGALRPDRAQGPARRRRLHLPRPAGRPPRAGGRDPRRPADRSSTSCTSPTASNELPDAVAWDDLLAGPGRARVRARRLRPPASTCSSRRAPPGCRRRSCTATAASSSSTSRASAWAGTSSPAGGCCGSRPPRG